ncbi:MAG: hypothetical protein WBD71_17995 [Xanthobacteraceae bacterium]
MTWYMIAKDFAAPVATIIAAFAAVWVTRSLNLQQIEIAKAQRDISLDRLKHDLFQKRYEVYVAAKSLIEYVKRESDFKKIDSSRIRELRVILDEARFFFGPEIRSHLSEIDQTCEALLNGLALKWQIQDDSSDPKWAIAIQQLGDASRKLAAMYSILSEKFEPSLRFDQLAHD